MESGSKLFLIDEDTSATNFMVRDELMQSIVTRDKEPITPFLERVTDLYRQSGISTILVAGSSGSYFYTADTVLQMDCYHTKEITDKVKEKCKKQLPLLFLRQIIKHLIFKELFLPQNQITGQMTGSN